MGMVTGRVWGVRGPALEAGLLYKSDISCNRAFFFTLPTHTAQHNTAQHSTAQQGDQVLVLPGSVHDTTRHDTDTDTVAAA